MRFLRKIVVARRVSRLCRYLQGALDRSVFSHEQFKQMRAQGNFLAWSIYSTLRCFFYTFCYHPVSRRRKEESSKSVGNPVVGRSCKITQSDKLVGRRFRQESLVANRPNWIRFSAESFPRYPLSP